MMLCPHCRHSDGLHTGPGKHGRGADGGLFSPNYTCGKCLEATPDGDGTSTPCDCPGWYCDLTPMQMAAETIAARAQHNKLADAPPFALTPPVGRRRPVQLRLF